MVIYRIKDEIISSATRIIFTHDPQTNQPLCLKMWLPCKNEVYNTLDVRKCTEYHLDGLRFNRRYAQNVYLGMAKILGENTKTKELFTGPLIEEPDSSIAIDNHQYVIVMKQLVEKWQLDRLLSSDMSGNERRVDFLAYTFAEMHKHLEISPSDKGTLFGIEAKATGNYRIFDKIWDHTQYGRNELVSLNELLDKTASTYGSVFEQRYLDKHIKRCHADLKANNMWLYPQESSTSPQLLLLDCVDFNPDFCHIDTLSDIAMMAIDLEMYLTHITGSPETKTNGENLVHHFLDIYLQATEESSDIWPLLEYYMTEKALVCAYMNIIYDDNLRLGEMYLDVTLNHTKKLSSCFYKD